MKKILIICGQTATGKTDLAFNLAKKYSAKGGPALGWNGAEIISADSRQVYREMDIGTGKDIPDKNIPIHGIDLVNPDEEFSVSQFREYALNKIEEILSRDKLPIIVGGTGFYIDAIFADHDLIDIPKDEKLRLDLDKKSAEELFIILKNLDLDLTESLNNSEKHNKQRLIRRIEVASTTSTNSPKPGLGYDALYVGLTLDKRKLEDRIKSRIQKRLDQGFEEEYKYLIDKYGDLDIFKNTLGYGQWPDCDKWLKEELKYAKRQLTWFRRNENINWFDADINDLNSSVVDLVSKWYSKSNA